MKYEVRILAAADADAADIFSYIALDNREAAVLMLEKMHEVMRSLEQNPERGARLKDKLLSALDFRFLIVNPYLIFYRVVGQEVHVHHIAHQRQSPVSMLMGFLKSPDVPN